MSTANGVSEPDDFTAGIAELERYLAQQAAPVSVQPSTPERPTPTADTPRVRRLRAEVAEAQALAELQDDDTPMWIESDRVRRRRRAAYEAARLHELAQEPTMRAWQASRFRRLLVTVALVALVLALAWSTAGVQVFAADGAAPWSPAWVFAWLVEPFMSLGLLVVVGARAYMSTRGQPIQSRTLARIEWLFLGLTIAMNGWRYLPGIAAEFSLSRLVLHLLGPVVAVAIVTALPIVLAAFASLDHSGTQPSTRILTPFPIGENTPGQRAEVAPLVARVRDLIDAGQLDPNPSAYAIRRALACGMERAAQVRDVLRAD